VHAARSILIAVLALAPGACVSGPVYDGVAYSIGDAGAERARVIEAARAELGERGYTIDRVDAARGVVTTRFRASFGSPTPIGGAGWARRVVADTLNEHEHAVRVGLRDDGVVDVVVLVRRVGRPGWRIETESVGLSSHARGMDRRGEAVPTTIETLVGRDGELARSIGEAIERRLGL